MGLFQGVERVLGGLGDVFEEAADVAGRQFTRVPFAVEQDELSVQ